MSNFRNIPGNTIQFVDDEAARLLLIPSTDGYLVEQLDDNTLWAWNQASQTWVEAGGGGGGDVSSVFGRTGAIVAESGDYTTNLVTEDTNLYFTDQRARDVISVTTPLTYDSVTGLIEINEAASGVDGYLSGTDWDIFNDKVNRSGDTMTGPLLLFGDPTVSTEAATKNYVDLLADGLAWKTLVEAATTTDITLSGEQTIDDIALVTGDRVLVKNQINQTQNGSYLVDSGAWTRTIDADTGAELELAAYIVNAGTVNGGKAFIQTTPAPITIGVTNIMFVNFLSTTYTATEQGIKLSGTQFSFSIDGSTLSQSASGAKVADGGITNTQINASAAIARTKLASGSANRILVNNGSGVMTDHTAQTALSIGYYDANGLPASSSATYSTSGAGNFTFNGLIQMAATTSGGNTGIIAISPASRTLHTAGTESVYVGVAGALANTGTRNVGVGQSAMTNITSGTNNTAVGYASLNAITTGSTNVGIGQVALSTVTTGSQNVAVGNLAGQNHAAAGTQSTYIGYAAGRYQINNQLTAIGASALLGSSTPANNTGTFNTAVGYAALIATSSGGSNTGVGVNALFNNTSGAHNTSLGVNSNLLVGTGSFNTALGSLSGSNTAAASSETTYVGYAAGRYQINGSHTAIGYAALQGNSTPANNTGAFNTAIGRASFATLSSGSSNVAIGYNVATLQTSASQNTYIGAISGAATTTGGSNTAIGYATLANVSSATGNTVVGSAAGRYLTASNQTAIGNGALTGSSTPANNTGTGNTAVGALASTAITSSNNTTSLGSSALNAGTSGVGGSTAIGYASLLLATGSTNTALGENSGRSITSGSSNIFIGSNSGYTDGTVTTPATTTGSIAIGRNAQNSANNEMVIGSVVAPITDSYIGSGVVAIAPASTRINATGASGANIGGGNLTFASGKSTGLGSAGTINFQTSAIGISGSSLNPLLTRLTIMAGGTLQGSYMHNNITDAQGSAVNSQIRSGTYAITPATIANISSATVTGAKWMRVGNIVHVTGLINITPTVITTLTQVGLSLPVPSNFSTNSDLSGIAVTGPNTPQSMAVFTGDIAGDFALMSFTSQVGGSDQTWGFSFSYTVI